MKKGPWLIGALAGICTGLLHFVAFPPWDVAEAAYLFALPLLLWMFTRPPRRRLAICAFLGFWLSWFLLIIWLRHVHPPMGSVGLIILSFLLALFPMSWALMAGWLLPPAMSRSFPQRLLTLLGLAGFWVILEWLKTWVLTGFPWLPLAASQWLRPAMLQAAEYGGQYAVSFILIFFNLTLAVYIQRLFLEPAKAEAETENADSEALANIPSRPRLQLRWRFCPEFYVALAMVFASVWIYVKTVSQGGDREPMLNVAAVQPWIPADLKWTQEMVQESLDVLQQETQRAVISTPKPDLILWPEAAPPYPIINAKGDRNMELWIADGIAGIGIPLITGALAQFPNGEWANAVFYIDPENGLRDGHYAKRRLVPFGEYIPLRNILFFIKTVVPLDIDLRPGDHSRPLPVEANGQIWKAGVLICYEDIFARLGREVAREGADFIVVVTNDGWYGEEAGAYQHAAHSVLRAVETRRPVVRCGNNGWSGWIDEYGNVRDVLTGEDGRVYQRGSKTFSLTYDPIWRGQLTFYVRYGDWVLWGGGVFLALAIWRQRRGAVTSK
ncbi:apolipoprotein N-acyltransferase [Cerasicoccus arenae]|uniref:Apolipoprotein N-acyltransferase n=1 Tax=Cerasicoccus arenae TaxID=424488 RepID=A0A8J3DBZ8_9BACT|nr:apolipoprotein N-acyltransferase [Cerasicoccus arenae]MBK1857419.1 apolipoprotein N-acyltransferase [Cerasicoccus arenae]GHC07832.1 apolipoprotein N-acyltransferase [Cerasicoccus arenae]